MSQQELNNAVCGIVPPSDLRARVIAAAAEKAGKLSRDAAAFDRRLTMLDGIRPDLINEGEYNPDYYKNMITRFTLCDPGSTEQIQGISFAVVK